MTDSYLMENLELEMKRLGLNDHSLAIKAGLKKDVIRDVLRGKTKQPAADKILAIANVLGRTAPELIHTRLVDAAVRSVSAHPSEQRATDVEERVAVRNLAPRVGDPINDIDEAALVGFFRRLTKTGKATLFGRIGIDELPSLKEQPIRKAQ